MINFFVKLMLLMGVAFAVMSTYYTGKHIESSSGYANYIIAIILLYGTYKFVKTNYSKDKVEFSIIGLIGLALLNVFVLCMTFFSLTSAQSGSLALFLKIIGFLILPSTITLISYSFARSILSRLSTFKDQSVSFRFLISLGFGFVLFQTTLAIFSFLGFYNIYSVAFILIAFTVFGAKELLNSITSLYTYKIKLPNHNADSTFFETLNLRLLSAELAFIIMTFLIGVNFINIIRPMPIGWDDLGAYMNWPQIMANSGSILHGAGMISWQVFTGIGFMFHSAPQAFFMNQVGGILSLVVLMVAFSDLLDNGRKRFLSLPILLATMFYTMPMVIFQQAKDMKLDPGLFFVSVIGIYLIYNLFSRYLGYEDSAVAEDMKAEDVTEMKSAYSLFDKLVYKVVSVYKSAFGEKNIFENKEYLIYLFIIGTIIGLAFAIKVTTLMLILGVIGVIFYSKLGFSGFLGYFSIFIGIFTRLRLWDMMNVSYPKDNGILIDNIGYAGIFIGMIILAYSFSKYKAESFKKAFMLTAVFLFGVFATLLPWFVKNIAEVKKGTISVGTILSGESTAFTADFSKIYSSSELKKINEKNVNQSLDENGKSQNEDMQRYFGYENGINNYLKLPINLTTQKNQGGEYTDITYYFLALLPMILLFLPYRNTGLGYLLLIPAAFGIVYYGNSGSASITAYFATKTLPGGYIYLVGIFLGFLTYLIYSLKHDRLSQIFKLNAVFFTMYGLVFVVAAYGIVWYGIAMYFSLLLMIGIGAAYVTEEKNDELDNLGHFFGSFILLIIISAYFFLSTIPHGFNNIKQASFVEYKAGLLNQEEGIFASHPDYFNILANLNIRDADRFASDVMSGIKDPMLKKLIVTNIGEKPEISKIEGILREVRNADLTKLGLDAATSNNVKINAKNLLNDMYKTVLYPPKEMKNDSNIYRIGTFLTYFIADNRNRFYEDSLIFNFNQYFADENPDVAVERMKKIGLKYLLVDLNAATIDKDPRHDLTKRFENLLKTFKSSKLELIQTDSLCLQMALDENNQDYMTYAGVNYESYTASGETINRGQKQLMCYNHILDLMRENKINDKDYPYLKPVSDYFKKSNVTDQNKALEIFQQYVTHGWLALFKIK